MKVQLATELCCLYFLSSLLLGVEWHHIVVFICISQVCAARDTCRDTYSNSAVLSHEVTLKKELRCSRSRSASRGTDGILDGRLLYGGRLACAW